MVLAIVLASPVSAQCLDARGNPTPCAPATTRRDPPLDNRRWIVLPFTNLTRAEDIRWLSATSVTLLSIDLSRWTDVRVVDDERVADLLREVPEAGRTQLGLQTGLRIAKRAGAGKLVMGDYLREGARITVTAKVYDVRTGGRTWVADQQATNIDSISAAYRSLAPKVLRLPVPIGTTHAGIGTSSTDAIRSYTLGMLALNRGRTDSAGIHFLQAVAFDSTFALAHWRLAGVINRSGLANAYPGGATRAQATAARLSTGLPERERLVIGAGVPVCEQGRRLLALDSADAEGWLAIGNCYLGKNRVIVGAGGEGRREASLDAARRAYERVLALQPNREAINRLQIWRYPIRLGCSLAADPCPPEHSYWTAGVYDGDTITTRFERVRRFDPPARRRESAAGRRAMFAAGRTFFAQWTATHPEDITAHMTYGDLLTQLGDLAGAQREFDAAWEIAQLVHDANYRLVYAGYRAEVQWKLGQAGRAAAILDSVVILGWPHYNTAFGRFSRGTGTGDTARRSLSTAFNSVYAGVVPAGFDQTMRAYAAVDSTRRRDILEVGTTLAFHALRTRSAADTASEFSLFRFQALLALGDSVRARRALAEYDAWGNERADDYWDAYEMFAAESHLQLGDTTTAWARIVPFAHRWPGYGLNYMFFWDPIATSSGRLSSGTALGRAWLLYADLAMATGHQDEARRGYTMIVGMWEKGEAPVQPLVQRAKEALVKLGS